MRILIYKVDHAYYSLGMTWQELTVRLDMEVRKLEGLDLGGLFDPLPTSDERFADRAEEMEALARMRVHAAVRAFISGDAIPELSNDALYFLEKRFWYALMLAQSFHLLTVLDRTTFVPNLQPAHNEHAVLEWLLIDQWEVFGVLLWIHAETVRYSAIASGNSSRQ